MFDITGNKYTYKLDANSLLDGKVEFAGHDYGSFDVYINGQKVADDVSNFDKVYPYGTEYEFKDLKGTLDIIILELEHMVLIGKKHL